MQNYKTILVERSGGLLKLTLNRPDNYNAMNPEMVAELRSLFAPFGR